MSILVYILIYSKSIYDINFEVYSMICKIIWIDVKFYKYKYNIW